ncbi:amino acid permease [Megasphaera vaginalis (ex Srinivasan et al. 2021)]|uniref:Lysine-specific permease n=1 Tax=Megasphaera vaginalis (ex Srinivasan et al. 2021) TaxID=1111454 RepID=U7UEJ4_9FIRM|nr:amino acid permease [Megasphaera vaginalis (ex Srinivasan et al. 2021)]ERT57857.1 lysine-specific permease [Megasphaera vaginalis (ex Srinivasan et al. 2021)]
MEESKQKLRRSLKARHMNMIAIGGAIGTGLFVAGGETVSTAGPGGALLSYSLIGIMVYFLMTSLGEMAAYLPVSGSFETYANRYVDKSLGFALGWNYWFNWAITVAAELVAGSLIMKYWFPDVPAAVWSGIFLVILFILNYLSTRSYGESEFIFAGIKVLTVIVFLAVGTLLIIGVGPEPSPGFVNWTIGEAPFVGGFTAMLSIFMVAGFSFQGTEMIGIAAGESEDPEKNIPRAVHSIFWRILLFYLGSFIIIGFLIPYTDENLLNTAIENISISPFTLVFERFGLVAAASIMNAVILTAVLSAGNSGLYVSTRMLYAMAETGQAPKCFLKLNKRGVPTNALFATVIFGLAAFLTSLIGEGKAYDWLVNISGMAGFITWIGIAICHYRFRRAFKAQNKDLSTLPYKASFFPFGPILALILCLIVTAGQNYSAFTGPEIDWYGASVAYIGIPVFFAVYLYHKAKHKTGIIPLENVDLSRSGNEQHILD